ncbi:hypothetical protein THRCLA_09608, partial [Thraustotheca clavata]
CLLYVENEKYECRGAMFGGFIPLVNTTLKLVVAQPLKACSEIQAMENGSMILVQRGGCPFTEKLKNVQKANGSYMVVVNNDDMIFLMQSIDWVEESAVAIAIGASDGAKLMQKLPTLVKISSTATVLDQCIVRIKKFLDINVPRLAIETFYHCHNNYNTESNNFYMTLARLFSESTYKSWEEIEEISLLSSISALNYTDDTEAYIMAGENLLLAGSFTESINQFEKDTEKSAQVLCGKLLSYFLMGNYEMACTLYDDCPASYWATAPPQYKVAIDTLHGVMLHNLKNYLKPGNYCSFDSTQQTFQFSTPAAKYIFESYTQMGVYLDELGAFESSLIHLNYGLQMCGEATGLQIRQALAIPSVFSDSQTMEKWMSDLLTKVKTLQLTDSIDPQHTYQPENAAYLKWTITPPTMLLGYQGYRVDNVQKSIVNMYDRLYPFPRLIPSSIPIVPSAKKRIGFISSWFRTHSVGKLFLGILQKLDRDRFEVIVFAATHFFPLSSADIYTKQFQQVADTFIVLSKAMDEAIDLIAGQTLDVLIFPEIGMDSWLMVLASYRFARVQCMFWGHPITSGLSSIDYFIASDHFFSDKSVLENYTEQVVLFNSLSTYFTWPILPSLSINRGHFHLPESSHIYICPQTIMKMHVEFDEILQTILIKDSKAYIVLLYSKSQTLWRRRLRDRFNRRKMPTHRIIFVETLPYSRFMQLLSIANVMLDPFPFGGGVTTLDALALGLYV